jgi:hypothetical protein
VNKELAPFVHPISNEAYLFGFEDYMTARELENLWEESLYIFKNEVSTPFGDITIEEIIESAATRMGLRIPVEGTDLAQKIYSQAYHMVKDEEQQRRDQHRDPDFINVEDPVITEQSRRIRDRMYQELLAERKHL